jgi:hypothetical protein
MNREETFREIARLLQEQVELERREQMSWGKMDKPDDIEAKVEELEVRCKGLADWLVAKGTETVSEEDGELLSLILAKIQAGIPIPLIPTPLVSFLQQVSFLAGYRKGYEVKELEHLVQ